jgi:hypothetical protein
MDMFLEVNQTIFYRIFKRLLKLLVKLLHVFKPLLLNVLPASKEQLLVNGEEFMSDDVKVLNKGFLLKFQLSFLLLHELFQLVQSSLLDFSQNRSRDDLKLIYNLCVTSLKIVDFLVILKAICSTLIYKRVSLS